MLDNRALAQRIEQCFRANVGKAVFSSGALLISQNMIVFFMLLAVQLFPAMFVIPLMAFTGILLLAAQYGFVVILHKLYTGQRAIIGDLFTGFRDMKRIGRAACLFFAIDFGVCLLCMVFVFLGARLFSDSVHFFLAFLGLYGLFVLGALLPFAFVWFELYAGSSGKTLETFKKSMARLRGHKGRLLALWVRTAGPWLAVALASYVLNFVLNPPALPDLTSLGTSIPDPEIASGATMLSSAATIVYYITGVVGLIKVVFSLSALYTELTNSGKALPPEIPKLTEQTQDYPGD